RSAQSARETAGKIEVAIQKSNHGVSISSNVASALSEIVEKARRVDAFVAEIAQASREQNEGIHQVNTAVSQMDKVTQSNASNAEETAAASEELSSQSQSLRETVDSLIRLIEGDRARAGQERIRRPEGAAPDKRRIRLSTPAMGLTARTPRDSSPEEALTYFR